MRQTKRYSAEDVLTDVVRFTEGPIMAGPEVRRLLRRVLAADTGFHVMASEQALDGVNVLRLRQELREFLRTGLRPDTGQHMPSVRVELSPTIVGTNSMLVVVDGPVRDILWFQIVRLMQLAGLDRLRLCDCGRVFVKTGRREFCSTRCQKRIYMRKFRQE